MRNNDVIAIAHPNPTCQKASAAQLSRRESPLLDRSPQLWLIYKSKLWRECLKLPNYERAVVPEKKITEYLLSLTHRDGKSKAKFFLRFGFSVDAWEIMATALLRHAADHELAKIEESPFGSRYVIEGEMLAADGRKPFVRSVWFIETGGDTPRLVSAYPPD
ncbi:hypothetical protein QUB75_22740 [Microcoleus sp. K1-B6]|uniref:DUF6883 domain-containing protein n=1 Tax=unclassified Microcoleus TaxID=2642155 RepID=UPI002FCF1AC2